MEKEEPPVNKPRTQMTIPPTDARDFFRIIQGIDVFLTTKLHMLKDTSLEEINRQRSAGFASPELLHGYVKENPDKLGARDLESVRSWADHVVEGRFLIHKERKDGCLFAHTDSKSKQPPVYLVKGLTQPISELVPFLPCFANTRLLPFRGHIVTDGIIAPLMLHIGSNMRGGFAEELKETLATRGLITTLPANAKGADPSALLAFLLSTAVTRRTSVKQIQALRQQSPELNLQYLLHMGRLNSKALKASLKAKGITGHFAVLEDTILTGAPQKSEAMELINRLVPTSLREAIVWFRL